MSENILSASTFATGQGFVYHNSLLRSRNELWREVGQNARENLVSTLTDVVTDNVSLTAQQRGASLLSMGYIEQANEINFLNTVFGTNFGRIELATYPSFINSINNLIGLKGQFSSYLNRLNKTIGEKYTITAGSNVTDKIITNFNAAVKELFTSGIMENEIATNESGQYDNIRKFLEDKLIEAIEKSLQEEFTKNVTNDGEDSLESEIREGVNRLMGAVDHGGLRDLIISRFRLDQLTAELVDFKKEKKKLKQTGAKGTSSLIRSVLKLHGKGLSSFKGNVQEFFTNVHLNVDLDVTKGATKVLSSNVARTDVMSLFSIEGQIDLRALLEDFNKDLSETSLQKTRDKLQIFTNEFLDKIDTGFIIQESAKNYTLSEEFSKHGFGNITKGTEIINLMNQAGYNASESFLESIYNLGNGAILDDHGEFREELKEQLITVIANFLFDDWDTIGVKGGRAIHVFDLNGVKVPLSYLLIATGKAILDATQNPKKIVNISISIPPAQQMTASMKKKGEAEILSFWKQQAEDAQKKTYISIHFLKNFTDLIQQMLKQL